VLEASPSTEGFSAAGARLSPRQREVLELAALGLTNHEVAERLNVTVHAVKFHLAAVYRKLGVANRTEAAVAFLHAGGGGRPV
jgi:DNA-binding NarL/FixJ family response regulator